MTTTLNGVTNEKDSGELAEQRAAIELVRLAKERGLSLTGPDGLLKQLTKGGARYFVERGDDRAPGS